MCNAGWVNYHYFNPEEPNEQQLHRDTSGEMPLIEALLKANAGQTSTFSEHSVNIQ